MAAQVDEALYVDKMAVHEMSGWVPHVGQMPVVESMARNRVAACGRRFGKSVIGGNEVVPEVYVAHAMQDYLESVGKRREFWIVGPEYSDSEKEFRVTYDTLKRMEFPFDKPGTYNDPHGGDMHISLWDGKFQLHAKSAKYPDTLVGEGLSGVILSEAAKLKERVWTKYLRPTLADFRGWAFMSSTPEGRNWFYRMWQMGQDPTKHEWASWRLPSWLNPHVYPLGIDDPEIESLRTDMTPVAFNQEIGADFSEFVGRVFGDWDEEVHVTDLRFNPSPDWTTYACVDYGFTNPFVWLLLQVGPWGEIHVLKECYLRNHTIPEIAAHLKSRPELTPSGIAAFYPDPAQPGDTRELADSLSITAGGGGGGELKERLDLIRAALMVPKHLRYLPDDHPEKLPQMRVDRSCTQLIHEFGSYRFPERKSEVDTNAPENPLKKDDHGPEALGRFFKGYFGHAGTAQGSTVSRAAIRRGRR